MNGEREPRDPIATFLEIEEMLRRGEKASTPSERLAWLEEANTLAYRVGVFPPKDDPRFAPHAGSI